MMKNCAEKVAVRLSRMALTEVSGAEGSRSVFRLTAGTKVLRQRHSLCSEPHEGDTVAAEREGSPVPLCGQHSLAHGYSIQSLVILTWWSPR